MNQPENDWRSRAFEQFYIRNKTEFTIIIKKGHKNRLGIFNDPVFPISERITSSSCRWEAIHQSCRSMDFKTRGWRDLVNQLIFHTLFAEPGRVKSPCPGSLIECNCVLMQQAHLPPVSYFLVLTFGDMSYVCEMLRKTNKIYTKKEEKKKCCSTLKVTGLLWGDYKGVYLKYAKCQIKSSKCAYVISHLFRLSKCRMGGSDWGADWGPANQIHPSGPATVITPHGGRSLSLIRTTLIRVFVFQRPRTAPWHKYQGTSQHMVSMW